MTIFERRLNIDLLTRTKRIKRGQLLLVDGVKLGRIMLDRNQVCDRPAAAPDEWAAMR